MRATPVPPPRASDARLIIGIAALLCGLSALAGGLRSPDGALVMADADVPPVWSFGVERGMLRPFADLDIAPAVMAPETMAHIPSVAPAPRQDSNRLLSGSAEGLVRATMNAATARWTTAWSVTATNESVVAYLVMSSPARRSAGWSDDIVAGEDTSGDGAVEASRATIEPGTYNRAELLSMAGPHEEESAFSARDEPQTFLLLTGAWSREREPSGIRSSTLHWATTVRTSEDLTNAASRP